MNRKMYLRILYCTIAVKFMLCASFLFPTRSYSQVLKTVEMTSDENHLVKENSLESRNDLTKMDEIPLVSRVGLYSIMQQDISTLSESQLQKIEEISFLVYNSYQAPTRTFHDIKHLSDLTKGADPIQNAAIIFHDVIYASTDGGLSDAQRKYIDDIIVEKDDGKIFITENKLEEDVEIVMEIFGFSYGQELNPFKGLNEFLSNCIATRFYKSLNLNNSSSSWPSLNAKITVCIEATIPFRGRDDEGRTAREALFHRLESANQKYKIGMSEDEMVEAIQRAAILSNCDVENFSSKDLADFLYNSFKLMPETNVPLRGKTFYLSDYAIALKKMAGFLEFLDPNNIYSSFRDPQQSVELREKTVMAKKNIRMALTYFQCIYLEISLLLAIAELSGGDVPISYFRGDKPNSLSRGSSRQIHRFLKYRRKPSRSISYDPKVLRVLQKGLKKDIPFTTNTSPVASFLYTHIGDEGLQACMKHAVHPMNRENALLLLQCIPFQPMIEVLGACSQMAVFRSSKIKNIVNLLPPEYIESNDDAITAAFNEKEKGVFLTMARKLKYKFHHILK